MPLFALGLWRPLPEAWWIEPLEHAVEATVDHLAPGVEQSISWMQFTTGLDRECDHA